MTVVIIQEPNFPPIPLASATKFMSDKNIYIHSSGKRMHKFSTL